MDKQNSPNDNRANQMNPNNFKSKGHSKRPDGWNDTPTEKQAMSKAALDLRSRQMNPNNELYYKNRK